MIGYVIATTGEGYFKPEFTAAIFQKGLGSYNIIAARLFGLSYPDYLRYVRKNFNATLLGRNGYSWYCFKNKQDCARLVNLLNNTWAKMEKKMPEIMKGELRE